MINVNLHPEGQKVRRKSRAGSGLKLPSFDIGGWGGLDALRGDPWRATMIISFIVVPVAVLGMWFTQRAEASDLENRLETAVADSTRLADLRALSDSLIARQNEIRARISLIERLDGDRFVWPHLMNQISAALPTGAWITSIERQSALPNLTLQLQAVAATPMTITEFVRALETSRHIERVRIVRSERQTTGGREGHAFTLMVHYSEPSEPVETAPLVAGGI